MQLIFVENQQENYEYKHEVRHSFANFKNSDKAYTDDKLNKNQL